MSSSPAPSLAPTMVTNSPVSVEPIKRKGSGTVEDPYIVEFEPNDSLNPHNWLSSKKWASLMSVSFGMMSGTFAVSAYTTGFQGMAEEFGVSQEVLAVGQTTFLLGLAFGSLIFPAFADRFGRRKTISSLLFLFFLFSIAIAVAKNIETVIICRFFAGLFSSAIQALGPASVQSLWIPRELAIPFTIGATAPFLGPSLGPLLGGYVVQYSGSWRNIEWLSAGLAGLSTILIAIAPETMVPYILREKARRLTKSSETGEHYISMHDKLGAKKGFVAEMQVFVLKPFTFLFKDPIVLLFSSYVAFLYGILNLFFSAYPHIYRTERHWSLASSGLPFIGIIIGLFFSIPITLITAQPYIKRVMRDGKADPEWRLIFAMPAAVSLPISLFWMGWTATPSVHWISPIIAGSVFGCAQVGITMGVFTYFADLYTINVGAVFAGLNFLRFAVGGIFPLFSTQMYNNLGTGWACSLLGFLLIVFLPAPFLFFVYGPKIRAKSKSFAAPGPVTIVAKVEHKV